MLRAGALRLFTRRQRRANCRSSTVCCHRVSHGAVHTPFGGGKGSRTGSGLSLSRSRRSPRQNRRDRPGLSSGIALDTTRLSAAVELAKIVSSIVSTSTGPGSGRDTTTHQHARNGSQVRSGLTAGGSRIRTLGPGCEKAASSGNGTPRSGYMGRTVVADSVNPLAVTRDAWRQVAATTSSEIVEIEVVCSDKVPLPPTVGGSGAAEWWRVSICHE
jgi:hypothetical protein